MPVQKDRIISLALSHARLHVACDMVHWAMTGETKDVLDTKEMDELRTKLKKLSDRCWEAMMKAKKG